MSSATFTCSLRGSCMELNDHDEDKQQWQFKNAITLYHSGRDRSDRIHFRILVVQQLVYFILCDQRQEVDNACCEQYQIHQLDMMEKRNIILEEQKHDNNTWNSLTCRGIGGGIISKNDAKRKAFKNEQTKKLLEKTV